MKRNRNMQTSQNLLKTPESKTQKKSNFKKKGKSAVAEMRDLREGIKSLRSEGG